MTLGEEEASNLVCIRYRLFLRFLLHNILLPLEYYDAQDFAAGRSENKELSSAVLLNFIGTKKEISKNLVYGKILKALFSIAGRAHRSTLSLIFGGFGCRLLPYWVESGKKSYIDFINAKGAVTAHCRLIVGAHRESVCKRI